MNSFSILINSSKLCLKKFCQMLLYYFSILFFTSSFRFHFCFLCNIHSILHFFFTIYRKFTFLCCFVFFFFLPANILSHLSSPIWTSLVAQTVKNLPTIVWSLDGARSPVEGNGNPFQYSFLEIPWTEEPGRLQSMGSPKSQTWLSNQIEPQ